MIGLLVVDIVVDGGGAGISFSRLTERYVARHDEAQRPADDM